MTSPPETYQKFVETFPALGEAWESLRRGGREAGPLDEKTQRLVKLAVAAGALREGAVHSAVRKARRAGASEQEIRQVVALAASTLGLPPTVAVWSWVQDVLESPAGG